jgi:capsule polysaccharide export protein KpsE/RkpR
LYPICSPNIDLGDLGAGFPLFFEFMRYLCIYLFIITALYFVPVALNIVRAQEELGMNEIELSESTLSMFSYGAFVHRSGDDSFTISDYEKRQSFAKLLAQQFMISMFVSSLYFFWMRR